MSRKRFDFIIEDTGWHRDIIRQYPKKTHVHGFSDTPPKTWRQVYKTYYSWCIMRQYYGDDGKIEPHSTVITFPMYFDECSAFPFLPRCIEKVLGTGEPQQARPLGQPGAEWRIARRRRGDEEVYDFEVFENYYNKGYRFSLSKEAACGLCTWLDEVNDYAMSRSEPI